MVDCFVQSPLDIPSILPLFRSMPRFTAMTCLFAFIMNAVVGGMGGILLCAHESGGTHWFEQTEHEESSHGPCCHHVEKSNADAGLTVRDCSSCEDTLLGDSAIGVAVSGQERLSLKAPIRMTLGPDEVRVLSTRTALVSAAGATRAPTRVANACRAFTRSVRILR